MPIPAWDDWKKLTEIDLKKRSRPTTRKQEPGNLETVDAAGWHHLYMYVCAMSNVVGQGKRIIPGSIGTKGHLISSTLWAVRTLFQVTYSFPFFFFFSF